MAPARGSGQVLRKRARSGPILPDRHDVSTSDGRLNRVGSSRRRAGVGGVGVGGLFRILRRHPFCLTITVLSSILFVAFVALLSPTMSSQSMGVDDIPWSRSSGRRRDGRVRRRRRNFEQVISEDNYKSREGAMDDTERRSRRWYDENEGGVQDRNGKRRFSRQLVGEKRGAFESVSCPDGSSGLLNDDYCDCSDGRDESVTSACSNLLVGRKIFPCADGNGRIFASRVLDGIKDCEDGSDEVERRLA